MQPRILSKQEKQNLAYLKSAATSRIETRHESAEKKRDQEFHRKLQTVNGEIIFSSIVEDLPYATPRDYLNNGNLSHLKDYFLDWNGEPAFGNHIEKLAIRNVRLSKYSQDVIGYPIVLNEPAGTPYIAELIAKNPKLKKLDLRNTKLGEKDANQLFKALKSNNQLIELNLERNDIPPVLLEKINNILKENALPEKNRRGLLIDLEKKISLLRNISDFVVVNEEDHTEIPANPLRINSTLTKAFDLLTLLVEQLKASKANDDFFLIRETISLVDQLLDPKNDELQCKKLFIAYGEKIAALKDQAYIKRNYNYINSILIAAVKFDLDELELAKMEMLIQKIDQCYLGDQQPKVYKFVKAIRQLQTDVYNDIQIQRDVQNKSSDEIQSSSAISLAIKTNAMLQKLKLTPESKQEDEQTIREYGKKYREDCKKDSRLLNFAKAVFTVVYTGLSTVTCATGCAVVGFFAFVLGAIPAGIYGGYVGMKHGVTKSKKWMGTEHESVGRFLLFKHSILPNDGVTVADAAEEVLTAVTNKVK